MYLLRCMQSARERCSGSTLASLSTANILADREKKKKTSPIHMRDQENLTLNFREPCLCILELTVQLDAE